MTEAKVANLCNWEIIVFLLRKVAGLILALENENVVHLDVSVDDASLVHVEYALEDILRPNDQLHILDRLILAKDAST